MGKPNIVIFNPDQMRADALAHLGNPAAVTPNLDAFARSEAVSFRNAHCQNPVCVPSRCSFLTGQYPHVQGHRTMNFLLRPDESSLLGELKDAGWHVWMNRRNDFTPTDRLEDVYRHCNTFFLGGKTPPAPGPENPDPRGEMGGKDFYSFYRGRLATDANGKNYSSDDEAVDEAIHLIRNRPQDQPFCIFLGLFFPHPPYQVEEPYFSAIQREKLPPRLPAPADMAAHPRMMQLLHQKLGLGGFTEADWDRVRAVYLGMCMKVDEQFGRLCGALKAGGIYDDTDIYFFSDHGDFTGDYDLVEKAQNLFPDCLTNVPLLIKPHKGVEVDPGVSDSLAELVDFYATAMDLAGTEPNHDHFGRSLRPVLANRSQAVREYVCAEGGRSADEKLQCSEAGGGPVQREGMFWPRMTAQQDDTAHTKAAMLRGRRYKYVRREYEGDELYDLEKDPGELVNRIGDPACAGVVAEMRMQMLDWYQRTCDAVPRTIQSGMSPAIVLEYAKGQLKPDAYLEFEKALAGKRSMSAMIPVCEQFGVRVI